MLEEYLNGLVAPANLPLSLLKFDLNINTNKQVLLGWKTTNEVNTKGFLIEKSFDGELFQTIATVKAIGKDEKNINVYSFTDFQSYQNVNFNSTAYYRLKIIDYDGMLSYSNVLSSKQEDSKLSFKVLTNPAHNDLTIVHENSIKDLEIKIYSVDAKLLLEKKGEKNGVIYVINISSLKSGNYIITFGNSSSLSTAQFIKQ